MRPNDVVFHTVTCICMGSQMVPRLDFESGYESVQLTTVLGGVHSHCPGAQVHPAARAKPASESSDHRVGRTFPAVWPVARANQMIPI